MKDRMLVSTSKSSVIDELGGITEVIATGMEDLDYDTVKAALFR